MTQNTQSGQPDSHQPNARPETQTKVRLRINELMAENGIRSVAALHRLLIARQIPVSHSQLLRIVDNRADHWKVEFIAAFIDIFKCNISDLFKVENNSVKSSS
jgi:uncharacterized protein YoaH (UPF0181 family)